MEKTEIDVDIPLENHILCDPKPKSQASSSSSAGKSSVQSHSDSREIKIFYKMKDSDQIYSDDEFPYKNANPSLISKVWQESRSLNRPGKVVTEFVRPEGDITVLQDFVPDNTPIDVIATCYQQQGHKKTFANLPTNRASHRYLRSIEPTSGAGTEGI